MNNIRGVPPIWVLALAFVGGCDPSPVELSPQVREAQPPDAMCDEPCSPGASCCTEVFVHGSGAPIGWLRRGAPIALPAGAEPETIALEFKRWWARHPAVSGLAAMSDITPLDGLTTWSTPPRSFGTLSTIRLHQQYRGVEVFGAGATVTLTVSPQHGVIAVHGAIADARETYAGWEDRLTPEAAITAADLLLAALQSEDEVDPVVYTVADPALVAVVELEAMAYTMRLRKNGDEVGSFTVRADDGAMLNLSFEAAASLPDPAPVTVRGRTFQSNPYALDDAAEHFVADFTQYGGAPLQGSIYMPLACQDDPEASPQCGSARLGNLEIAVVDALGQDLGDATTVPFVPTSPSGEFLAQPPATKDEPVTPETRAAALQDGFYRLLATFRLFAPFKAGRWDSLWEDLSGFKAEFVPRVVYFYDRPGCPDGAPGCAGVYFPFVTTHKKKYVEHPWTDLPAHRPAEGPDEGMGFVTTYTEGFRSIDMLFHEFGHVLDVFTFGWFIGYGVIGSGCKNLGPEGMCQPACALDTTDESDALAETLADFMGLFAIGRLYTNITYDDHCGAISAIANAGAPTPVHSPTCVDDPGDIRSFLDERPTQPGHVPTDDGPIPTGKCTQVAGYRQGALMTAWWEWIHGQGCDASPPFTCTSFGGESFGASTGLEAMLYALSLTNDTYYRKFITDAETYLQCVHGDGLGDRWRAVWCHHGGLECAHLPSPCPAICGDGVAQGEEACDLEDLSETTCDGLGFAGGALSCKPDCTFDTSACEPLGPPPTTGETPTTGSDLSSGDSSGPAPDSATAGGGVNTDPGCGCTAPSPGGAWLLGLAPLLWRRRRRLDLDRPTHPQ